MRPRILFPLVLFALVSCSGSAKSTSAVPALPTSSAPAATATTATTATAASTSVATTVSPATTSTTAAKTLEQVVAEAAAQNWMVDREGCYLAMNTCDPTLFTPEGSVQRDMVTKVVTDSRAANLQMRTSPDDPSYIVLKKVVLGPDRTTAEVTGCYWDTGVMFEPNDKATGGEIIYNDKKQSDDVILHMVLVGKRWLVSERTRTTTYEGFNSCPAR
jgi:hypothetical protein